MVHNNLLSQAEVHYPPLYGPGIAPGANSAITLELIIGNVIGIITIIAVIYFTFQIIFAGYAYITTEGDKSKMEAARKRITEGILGLVVVVVALGLGALVSTLLGIDNALNLDKMFIKMGL